MEIDIYSDVTCPWCYLGRVRLQAALDSLELDVIVRSRAFQVDPVVRDAAHVSAVAAREGLELTHFRPVDTLDAHRLLWFADQPGAIFFGAGPFTQGELATALHQAHFTLGRDIADRSVLIELAAEAGIEEDRVHQLLTSTEGKAEVRGEIARAHDLGIRSVPTFVFAGKHAITGAQGVDALRAALLEALRREGMVPGTGLLIPRQRSTSPTLA